MNLSDKLDSLLLLLMILFIILLITEIDTLELDTLFYDHTVLYLSWIRHKTLVKHCTIVFPM